LTSACIAPANRRDSVQIQTWKDVEELFADRAALEAYNSLVVDTVGRCLDVLKIDIIEKNPKHGNGAGSLSQQGWGALGTRFRGFITAMKALGKDVLLVSHDKEDKDGDVRVVRPDIQGQSYGEVMKSADFVGYLYMHGKARVLDFSPTDRWIGKNPAQWAPLMVPEVGKATDFFASALRRGREALGKISEASAETLKQVEDWRATISSFKSAKEYNAAIPQVKALDAVLSPQVSKMLLDVAKSAGIVFDKDKKAFVDPAVPETPVLAGAGAASSTMFD
jgi:hypothetical protein